MGKTSIEWCTHSLNFIKWWCTKKSEGCKNCYMMALAARYPQHAADHAVWRDNSFKELKALPAGAEVFVGDMYDLFHEEMPLDFIQRHFQLMHQRPDCTFLLLTKRPERALEVAGSVMWTDNIWLGTSIENRKRAFRLDVLKQHPTMHKYLSLEPLLEDISGLDYGGIEGVIVGGESGDSKRPFSHQWADRIRQDCERTDTAFFFKQGSSRYPGQDRLLNGQTYDALAWRKEVAPVFEQKGMFS